MEAFVADNDRMRPKPAEEIIGELIASGESLSLEFKSTARWNVKEGKADKAMEHVIVKTVAAFLNSKGGDLLIGVKDDGSIFGIEADHQLFSPDKRNRDTYENWLMTQLLQAFGKQYAANMRVSFAQLSGRDVCRVAVLPSSTAVYVKEGDQETLFVRAGNSTRALTVKEAVAYHQQRFAQFNQPLAEPPAEPVKSQNQKKYGDFRNVLETVAAHPNLRYFVLKSIILNNLFGVDIMEEAVEICKLRLFLKLAAQVEPDTNRDNLGIEPLPDIDFNIRAGNTLVGYATEAQLESALNRIGHSEYKAEIKEKAEIARLAVEKFRNQQIVGGTGSPEEQARWKADADRRLDQLRDELDDYLAGDYNVKKGAKAQFESWRQSHQPFHWFVEFFGIMRDGGFDAVIGNPPWREYSVVKKTYTVRNYPTEKAGNIYALFIERCLSLRSNRGAFSFIVQLPLNAPHAWR